jgi:hypothetical protein
VSSTPRGDDAGSGDFLGDLKPRGPKACSHDSSRADLLKAQLRVTVEVTPQANELSKSLLGKSREHAAALSPK